LCEVKVCVLNETENVDLTVERKYREQRAEKEKEPFNKIGRKKI